MNEVNLAKDKNKKGTGRFAF